MPINLQRGLPDPTLFTPPTISCNKRRDREASRILKDEHTHRLTIVRRMTMIAGTIITAFHLNELGVLATAFDRQFDASR